MTNLLCLLQKSLFIVMAVSVLFPGIESEAQTLKPLVAGKRGVVAAGHALVAEAGLRILEKGGNAVDAGVATVFAASVIEMGSFGSGGECPILIKLKDGPVMAINGAGIVDLDNDGLPDLFLVTGNVYANVEEKLSSYPYRTPRVVFRNIDGARFEDVTARSGPGPLAVHSSRGAAFGDFDNDGDVDVLIMNMNEPPKSSSRRLSLPRAFPSMPAWHTLSPRPCRYSKSGQTPRRCTCRTGACPRRERSSRKPTSLAPFKAWPRRRSGIRAAAARRASRRCATIFIGVRLRSASATSASRPGACSAKAISPPTAPRSSNP